MHIIFESRSAEGGELRELSIQRLRFALRRLTALVPRVKLQLSDVNGPRGGVDKRCQLALQTDGAGTVLISAQADNWRGAIEAALLRATRTLTRHLQRSHRPTRGRSARLALQP